MTKKTIAGLAVAILAAFVAGRFSGAAQDPGPEPSCNMCDADFVPAGNSRRTNGSPRRPA